MSTLPEDIYKHSLRLPESEAREVPAFIHELELRLAAKHAGGDKTEAFLKAVAGRLGDDFPDDIDDADLGPDLRRETLD